MFVVINIFKAKVVALILPMIDKSYKIGFCYLLLMSLYIQILCIWSFSIFVFIIVVSILFL